MSGKGWCAKARRLLSAHDSFGPQRILAFTTRKNRVCSTGFNSYTKTHPAQNRYARLAGQPKREFLHAEIAALLRAPADVDTLHIYRFDKQGNPVSAAPCPVCRLAINAFNPLLRVVHS